MEYDSTGVVIVGAGPAGLFAAEELVNRGIPAKSITIVEAGKRMANRHCPATKECNCPRCDILEGEGGSGGFSDGKNTYSLTRGTQMEQIFDPSYEGLLKDIDNIIVKHGRVGKAFEPLTEVPEKFVGSRFRFDSYSLRHIGSDGIQEFIVNYTAHLRKLGVRILANVSVKNLLWHRDGKRGVWGVNTVRFPSGDQMSIKAACVVLATGLQGIPWLEFELARQGGLKMERGPAGIGIRVEVPYESLSYLFDKFYDFKLVYEHKGLTFRSFCCNQQGYITNENHRTLGVRNVNGHSYLVEKRSQMSNFAIICKVGLDDNPDPQMHVRDIARSINFLPKDKGQTVAQRLSDFLLGIPTASTSEVPYRTNLQSRIDVNIGDAMPKKLYDGFAGFLKDLSKIVAIPLDKTWIYAPEVKYFGLKLPVDFKSWRCEGIDDLYIIGNASGYLDSFVSAALTGMIAAKDISERYTKI